MDDPPDAVTMTITPRTSTVLQLADQIARRHGHGYVGTEHLLLALIEEGNGIAAQVLIDVGAAQPARERTERILTSAEYQGSSSPEGPSSRPEQRAQMPASPPLRLTVPVARVIRLPLPPGPPDLRAEA